MFFLIFVFCVYFQELATKTFKKLSEAYEILSNDTKRKIYDDEPQMGCCHGKHHTDGDMSDDEFDFEPPSQSR